MTRRTPQSAQAEEELLRAPRLSSSSPSRLSVLLATLVLAAIVLGGQAPKEAPKVKIPAEETRGVKVPIYDPDTGELDWLLLAAKVTPSPDDPRVLLGSNVKIAGYRKGAVAQTVTADKGAVNTESRAATLEGNVVMELHEATLTRIEADDIQWDNKNGTAWSKGPVKLTRADVTVEGVGLRLWLSTVKDAEGRREKTGHAVVERRVRAELLPGSDASLLHAPDSKSTEPIIITSDGSLTISRSELAATFRNNVRASQGKMTLTCDLLSVSGRPVPNEKGKMALEAAVATGNVRVDDSRTVALADTAEWRREQGSIRLTGRPAEIRWDNGNRLVGGLIQRTGDGAEILCAATPECPREVYLLAHTIDRGTEGTDKPLPNHLRPGDIADWPAFCTALATQGKAKPPSPGKRVLELLPEDLQAAIHSVAQGSALGSQRKSRITIALNTMLNSREFYRETDFRGIALPPEAAELLKAGPKALDDAQVRRLNRLLLEAAFPGLIAKSQEKKPN